MNTTLILTYMKSSLRNDTISGIRFSHQNLPQHSRLSVASIILAIKNWQEHHLLGRVRYGREDAVITLKEGGYFLVLPKDLIHSSVDPVDIEPSTFAIFFMEWLAKNANSVAVVEFKKDGQKKLCSVYSLMKWEYESIKEYVRESIKRSIA